MKYFARFLFSLMVVATALSLIASTAEAKKKKHKDDESSSSSGKSSSGEQCTDGVHDMLPWTGEISGNAGQWANNARSRGFRVDHHADNGCVIVYPSNYGSGIDTTYGHVAVLREVLNGGWYKIQESNSGHGDKSTRTSKLDLNRVQIIHPK